MKIAIYSRKSKFTGIGDSIENQINMCREFAINKFSDKKIDFYEFEDEGFTGSNLNRPEFKKLIKNIKDYDVLICYRLDRISRNVADFSSTLEILQNNNCDFISIKEQFDTSSPMGRAMIYIASVFAQLERETIAERIKDNMLEMAKKGSWTGGRLPLGFSSIHYSYKDENENIKKAVKLIPNTEDLKIVKLIYEIYTKENSLSKTEAWFRNHNIKSKKSFTFKKTSLKTILQNPVYVKCSNSVINYFKKNGWNVYGIPDNTHSLLTYNKTKSVNSNGKCTKKVQPKSNWIAAVSNISGIIDSETWLDVQKNLNNNKETQPNLGKTNNVLLTGILKCSTCKSNMIIHHGRFSKKENKIIYYYTCSLKKLSHLEKCTSKNIRSDYIEDAVLQKLQDIPISYSLFLSKLKYELNKTYNIDSKYNRACILKSQIENKKIQINSLIDKLYINDDIADLLMQKIALLKNEITLKENELNSLNKLQNDSKNEIFSTHDLIDKFYSLIDIMNFSKDEQKKFILSVVESMFYDSENSIVTINLI